MSLFETGPVVTTPGIRDMINLGPRAIDAIQKCLDRHCQGDWGDLCDEDKQLNQDFLDEKKEKGFIYDNLFSSYETDFGKIYIITECDRFLYDLTSQSTYSELGGFAEWGKNRDGESLKQINIGLATSSKGDPIAFEMFPVPYPT